MPESFEDKERSIQDAFSDQFTPALASMAVEGPGFWVAETFDDFVIVSKGGDFWHVAYTKGDEGIQFADRDDWEPVEKRTEWVAKIKNFQLRSVKKITEDDNFATVAGMGVIFGGRDLQLETFTKSTDYMLDLVPEKVITYDHTLSDSFSSAAIKGILGHSINESIGDAGIWVEAQLDKSKKYVDLVLQLVELGILGWSSGTAAHLVEMDGHKIKRWPVVEWSLTPTPSEPRALGVERLKVMAQKFPGLQVALKGSHDPRVITMAGAKHYQTQLKAKAWLVINDLE